MILLIDLATMAVMHPGGIPVTDLSLVRGDKLPLRITLLDEGTPVTPSGTRPALAVKTALGDDTLVLAATNLEPVDDALGLAYVGSLSVNTTQLIAAMGSADRIDLVAEVVIIDGDGSQSTSSLIKVRVRQDIMPADVVPPEDVVVNWEEMVAASLANQLPDALHNAGMYVTPASGTASMSPPGYDQDQTVAWSWARFKFGDDTLLGYQGNVCKVRDVYMWAVLGTTDTTPRWLDIWRRAPGGDWVLAARSSQAVASSTDVDLYMWGMIADTDIVIGDEVALHVYGGTPEAPVEIPLSIARQMVTAADGRGIASALDGPITDATVMPAMMLSCTYQDGVSVGGVNLATRAEVQRLTNYAAATSKQTYQDARASEAARDAAQEIAEGLAITVGTVTTGEPGSQATASLTPGSTPGSWQLDMTIPRGDVGAVDTSKSYTWTQPQVFDATVTASRGVRVPLPATAQEALSYEALLEQQTADDWRRANYYMETLIPSWVTTLVRQMQMSDAYNVVTANASSKEAVYTNDLHDFLITMMPSAGVSLIGRSTGAWKFANYMGDHNNSAYAAAVVWRIIGSDKASILLGSTSQGYSSTTNPAAPCYAHPIHWADYNLDAADYRYPLLNAVNNYTSRDMAPAWQVTIYPTSYLGSTTSCLIRGTDYGRDVGDQLYMWALVPKITYVAVAMAPRAAADHQNTMNRWELFVDGNYVMPMTSLFCGSGHTACVTVKAKAHEASSTLQVGLRMGGMRIDAAPALGVNDVRSIMGRVVMDGVTAKPMPAVTASALDVPAEGGEVTLTVSSTLSEAVYILNDTMCGHDPAAVWCMQSSEQTPAGGGQITLTLAPNTTGQPRQVWAFVGHHYAQASVVKINQLA